MRCWKAPLRLPAMFMLWGGLVLDSQAQELVNGAYKSPLYILGQLLLIKLNSTIPIGPLVVSGVDLLVFFGFALYGYRRITGSRIDRIGVIDMPRPLIAAAFIALAGVGMVWALGLARGGSFRFSLWQVQRCIYVPLVFLYFSIAFPQAREHRWLIKFILGCALFKAVMSIGLRFVFKDADYIDVARGLAAVRDGHVRARDLVLREAGPEDAAADATDAGPSDLGHDRQ